MYSAREVDEEMYIELIMTLNIPVKFLHVSMAVLKINPT
jgi:hypothetical protein